LSCQHTKKKSPLGTSSNQHARTRFSFAKAISSTLSSSISPQSLRSLQVAAHTHLHALSLSHLSSSPEREENRKRERAKLLGSTGTLDKNPTRAQCFTHRTPPSDRPAPHLHGHDLTSQKHAQEHAFIKAGSYIRTRTQVLHASAIMHLQMHVHDDGNGGAEGNGAACK
jgi:hypothetical protein